MTDLEKKKSTEVSTQVNYGATDDITQDDCELGRIQVMQALSELVKTKKAQIGQIINLVDGTVLGDEKTPFEFVIVGSFKYWVTKRGDDFVSKTPAISSKEKPWEEDGGIKNIYHHSFIVLNVEDLKNGAILPCELPFRSTEIKTAKTLSSILMRMRGAKLAAHRKTFLVTSQERKKNKHDWMGMHVTIGRDTTPNEFALAEEARNQFVISKEDIMKENKDLYEAQEEALSSSRY